MAVGQIRTRNNTTEDVPLERVAPENLTTEMIRREYMEYERTVRMIEDNSVYDSLGLRGPRGDTGYTDAITTSESSYIRELTEITSVLTDRLIQVENENKELRMLVKEVLKDIKEIKKWKEL